MRADICNCPQAVHVHGSRTTYVVHRCRCDACREDNRLQAARRTRAKLYGRYNGFVDGDQVRAHLRQLMGDGMGWKQIARTSGVAPSTACQILYGKFRDQPDHPEHRPPRRQVTRAVADKLLAVQAPALADGALVDATGSRRRIRALVARGWSLTRIADALDVTISNLHLHTDGQQSVTVATRRRVTHLYDRWWDQDPAEGGNRRIVAGAARARLHAARAGWAPPAMWDDDLIDDPNAPNPIGHPYCTETGCLDEVLARGLCQVHYDRRRLPVARRRARSVDPEDAAWLADAGESIETIARRLGSNVQTVQRTLQTTQPKEAA